MVYGGEESHLEMDGGAPTKMETTKSTQWFWIGHDGTIRIQCNFHGSKICLDRISGFSKKRTSSIAIENASLIDDLLTENGDFP